MRARPVVIALFEAHAHARPAPAPAPALAIAPFPTSAYLTR